MARDRNVWRFNEQLYWGANLFGGTHDTIDAAAEQVLMYGQVTAHHWTSGTKDITAVEVVFTTVTNGTGTTIVRVSLADPDTVNGPPVRHDGVLDQSGTRDITTLSANTVQSFSLGSTRTVSRLDELCVVIDFSTFGTGPSLITRSWNTSVGAHRPALSSYIGTPAWALRTGMPCVALVCTDGTRIYLNGWPVLRNLATVDYNSTTTGSAIDQGDERGMLWRPRKPWLLTGGMFPYRYPASGAGEIVLYRDTTVLWSETMSAIKRLASAAYYPFQFTFSSPIPVYPDDAIRLTLRPTSSTTGWRVQRVQLADDSSMKEMFGGEEDESRVSYTQRVDQGAWVEPSGAETSFCVCQLYGTPAEPWGIPRRRVANMP